MRLSKHPQEWVVGQVYFLREPSLFEVLDRYEGPQFARVVVQAIRATGNGVSAWVYVWRGRLPEARRIFSGDFLEAVRTLGKTPDSFLRAPTGA
jgi:gamma-glutamylcyclotransferase (GGCT)/AIG2-like uncharacterized protein YtfP